MSKKQQGKLPARAVATLDFAIQHIHEVAMSWQAPVQRIAGCLPADVILQLRRWAGDVFRL